MSADDQESDREVVVKSDRRVFSGFFSVHETLVSHPRFDGRRQTVTRLTMERGDSVGVLLLDIGRRKVWLVEQFRYATHANGPGWIVELPAGMVREGEDINASGAREVAEETGFTKLELERVSTFYVSPGGTSERIFLYVARVDGKERDADLARSTQDEDEDIRLLEIDVDDFLEDARLGRLDDAKTLIAGLWVLANRERLAL